MDANYSLADLSAVTNGTNGGGSWLLLILFVLLLGGNGAWGNRGEFGQYDGCFSMIIKIYRNVK